MVLEVTRLRLYVEAYTRKDRHEGRHPIKKGSSKYKRRQQRCSITKEIIMDKDNNSRNYDARKTIADELDIIKKIKSNNTREQEVVQALKKKTD